MKVQTKRIVSERTLDAVNRTDINNPGSIKKTTRNDRIDRLGSRCIREATGG